jgi:hypothetical protein
MFKNYLRQFLLFWKINVYLRVGHTVWRLSEGGLPNFPKIICVCEGGGVGEPMLLGLNFKTFLYLTFILFLLTSFF